jgi:predicted Fe-Mo cluster-binding NifX family protein
MKKMMVAVPVWQGRVSPLFDTAETVLLFDVENGNGADPVEICLEKDSFNDRVKCLEKHGVKVLICGAISQPLARIIGTHRIVLIPWVAGEVREVISAYADGSLADNKYMMPGIIPA